MAFTKDKWGWTSLETLAVGSRRDLIQVFSRWIIEGQGDYTTCLREDDTPYTTDELIQLLEDCCTNAIDVGEFLRTNSLRHLRLSETIDGQRVEHTIASSRGLGTWAEMIRSARRKDKVIEKIECRPVFSEDPSLCMMAFKRKKI